MQHSPRRQVLRQGTAQAHSALDTMIGPFSSQSAYEAYLIGMARFRLPLEDMIVGHLPSGILKGWRPNLISTQIKVDLAALGLTDDVDVDQPPIPEQTEDWLGVFYVLEGSSLGAKLLVKRAQALGLTATNGAAHLLLQAGNFSSWAAFLDIMEAVRDIDEARMVLWANSTFANAHKAFESSMNAICADC